MVCPSRQFHVQNFSSDKQVGQAVRPPSEQALSQTGSALFRSMWMDGHPMCAMLKQFTWDINKNSSSLC